LQPLLSDDTPRRTLGQRLLWLAQAELALARSQPQTALAIVDRLYGETRHLQDEAEVPRLARTKAAALAAAGELEAAVNLLRRTQTTVREQGDQVSLWAIRVSLSDILGTMDRDDEAEREGAEARAIAERLAATIPAGELRDHFLRASGQRRDEPLFAPVDRAATASASALTPREHEVAAHVAAGESSRAIAAQLFVSERTIEAHVANILRKLGVPSRAGIAAWVAQQGVSRDT
jgi:DNA-binding CsgD family transcriptional regulator